MNASANGRSGLSGVGRFGVAALLLIALLGRAIFVALPVNSDTAMFVYAGRLVAEGGRPGVDLLDNKLPTVGLMMSMPWRLFGPTWPAYALLGLALSCVAVIFLWRAARDVWGRPAAAVVATAATVWLNFPPAVYGQLQLETIQIFFAAIAGATTLRLLRRADARDACLVGLCGGIAAWAKPTGGAVAAAALLAILLTGSGGWRGRVCVAGWIAMGAVMPVILAAWAIVVTGMGDALPATLRQLHDYAAGSTLSAMDLAKPAMVLGLLGFPLLILGGVFRRDRRSATATRADVLFIGLWFAAELAGVVSQRRMYAYHFLPLGPPAAMAAGLLARRVRARSLAMAFGPVVAMTLLLTIAAWQGRPTESRDDRVIAYLDRHAAPADAVWADDYPRLLVETGRRAGSGVPLIFLMANGDAAPDFFGQQLLADFAARRPAYVAFAAEPKRVADLYRHHMAETAASPARADAIGRQLDAIQAYLLAHYHAETDIGNVRIWRRNATPTTERLADSAAAGD